MRPFAVLVNRQFSAMSRRELFVTDCSDIFDVYLGSFPEGTNPMFRSRREYDCQTCKQFIRRLGGLVSIENGVVSTVWDVNPQEQPFDTVAVRMSEYVRSRSIKSVFRTKERTYGDDHNYDAKGDVYHHFWGVVSSQHFTKDPEEKRSEQDAIFQVLRRGLNELRESDLETVLELIDGNNLYRGDEWRCCGRE